MIILEPAGFHETCTANSNHRNKVRPFWGRHNNTDRIKKRWNLTPKKNFWSIQIRSQTGERMSNRQTCKRCKLVNTAGSCKPESKVCSPCAKQTLPAIFFGQRCSLNAIKWFHPCVSSTSSSFGNISDAALNSPGERSTKTHTHRSESKLTQILFVSIIKSSSTKNLRFSTFQAGAQGTR